MKMTDVAAVLQQLSALLDQALKVLEHVLRVLEALKALGIAGSDVAGLLKSASHSA